MLQIGSLSLDVPIFQSAMSGWSDLPFRLVAREHGAPFAFTEMLLADAALWRSPQTMEMLRTVPEDRPLGAQLVGYTPDSLAHATSVLVNRGIDMIDLNFACPVRKIVSRGGGAALLCKPDIAKEMFARVISAAHGIPVTVKLRIGFTDGSGEETIRIARIAEDAGISALFVHGRTRTQGYSGNTDYDAIARVKRAVRIPVIGNGDVFGASSARRLLDATGCDGVMIGRAAPGNPWIYHEAAAGMRGESAPARPDPETVRAALLRHTDLEIQYRSDKARFHLRRIACAYFKHLPGAVDFRRAVNATRTVDEIRRIIEDFRCPETVCN